jgi:hypothetical protein
MLSASGSLTAIRLDQLLSGRLKKYGVECKKSQNFFWISGNDGDLGVRRGRGRVCKGFFRGGRFPRSVLAAIEKEFNVKIVNEYDPRFWECTSKEELAANVRKTERRIPLLEAAKKVKAAKIASGETGTGLQKRAISPRVSRTLGIVADRIDHELDECWEYFLSVPHAAYK